MNNGYHLAILVIIFPLLAAIISPLVGRIYQGLSWLIAAITTLACFIISVVMLQAVLEHGRISYWSGGWPPPYGIEVSVDYASIFVLILVSFIAFVGVLFAYKSIAHEIQAHRLPVFYSVYLLFITGLMGIVVTGDIFNFYVFLEITSIAGYTLIALGKNRRALVASFNYVIIGTVGATFILLGIAYLYLMTGTLNMVDMAARLPAVYNTSAVLIGFALLATGLAIKVALFPLHLWLPNAYTYAPSVISAVMAATATKVGAYAFIRIIFTVFTVDFFMALPFQIMDGFLWLSLIAILYGSVMAIAQTDIKKMLAYSSIGQIGYIVLGISLMTTLGLVGALIHILNHALMKGALFLVVGAVVYKAGITTIDGLRGMGKKMPVTMAAFTMGALSMIGVPLTVGFVSKWYLAIASIEVGMWYLVPVILVSSVLTAIYFWRVLDNIYFKGHDGEDIHAPVEMNEAPVMMLLPTLTMAVLCIVFGIIAFAPVSLAENAAIILLR